MNISAYYEQISKQPLLSREEELDLFMEMQDVGLPPATRAKAREKLLTANLRFVFKRAKHYSKNDPDQFAELIAAGNEGLVVAIDKYKPQTGFKFLTYAGAWVDQRILKCMSSQRIVALPIRRQQVSAKIQKEMEANQNITIEELRAAFPDVSERDLTELSQTRYLTFYIEDIGEDPSFEINPIEDQVHQKMDREILLGELGKLTPIQKQVLDLTFGISTGESMKPDAVSKAVNLPKEKVRKIKKEALVALKASFGGVNPFQ